jgi:hypothetical protein
MPIVRDTESGVLWCTDCNIPVAEDQREIERHRDYHAKLFARSWLEEEAP